MGRWENATLKWKLIGLAAVAVGRYEDVLAFLSPPMTLRSLLLSTGVDVCGGETPCRLPLTLRTVGDWYPATLGERQKRAYLVSF